MTELPPLPEQCCWLLVMHGNAVSFANNAEKAAGLSPGASTQAFTAEQMRAYAAEAVRVALEKAAQVCDDERDIRTKAGDSHPEESESRSRCYAAARAAINCALEIRALKGTP